MDEIDRIGDHRCQSRRTHVEVVSGDRVAIERKLVEHLGEDRVLLLERDVELLPEDLRIEKVLHSQTNTRGLVGIGRTDAALGGTDLVLAQTTLGELVEFLVIREDQMRVAADLQLRGIDTLALEHVEFGDEHARVDHHSIADDRRDVRVENAAGHQLQLEGLAIDHEGVARVVTALIADDEMLIAGEQVGELALPLVTPLGSDDDGCWHGGLLDGTAWEPGNTTRSHSPQFHRFSG